MVAIVDAGSHDAAAAAIHKRQSALSYAIQRIEALLGVEVVESVLAGTAEALTTRAADLAIAGVVPQGFVGEPLIRLGMLLADGGERYAELYLVFGDRENAGPGVLRLADLLRERVRRCPGAATAVVAY